LKKEPQLTIVKISKESEYITENLGDDFKLEMVYIPSGDFRMGCSKNSCERPTHQVTLKSFYMGKYTITQKQYQSVMSENPSRFQGDNRPVECVSWDDAVKFCQKLSNLTGKKYTLPSESQWEYACRAETTTPFYFGEIITPDFVNYNGNYIYGKTIKGINREGTTNVGIFPPNCFGLYDMHGNVREWCLDTWNPDYRGDVPKDGSAWIKNSYNKEHPLRGGSWIGNPDLCRSSNRSKNAHDHRYHTNGFRVVLLTS
jgi:eukaryotic-like serine/threonine-protein kinase